MIRSIVDINIMHRSTTVNPIKTKTKSTTIDNCTDNYSTITRRHQSTDQ